MPTAPEPAEPTGWEHYELWRGVREALLACPDNFTTPTNIEGLMATDVFTLNTALSATIETSVVDTLNGLRSVWDPHSKYRTYAFVRQSQTFPDVVLRQLQNGSHTMLGIELKGWYLLAKEGEPSFRFKVTPAACNPWDLLVVVPWVLSNVLAGTPVLLRPFVAGAQYCAEQRNHYWLYERAAKGGSGTIELATDVGPYPEKGEKNNDHPSKDPSNFGRVARYGPMKKYVVSMCDERIGGIAVRDWQKFFKEHTEKEAQ